MICKLPVIINIFGMLKERILLHQIVRNLCQIPQLFLYESQKIDLKSVCHDLKRSILFIHITPLRLLLCLFSPSSHDCTPQGVGFGTPGQRAKQYQQYKVQRAIDTVYEYKTGRVAGEYEVAMVTKDKKETRKMKTQ